MMCADLRELPHAASHTLDRATSTRTIPITVPRSLRSPSRRARTARVLAAVTLFVLGALPAPPAGAERPTGVQEVSDCEARPTLGPGSTGADVRCLQYLLILLGLPVQYTGRYDQATADAVRWYQATHPPLTADGIAGEQTLLALGVRAAAADPATPTPGDPPAAAGGGPSVALPTQGAGCLADAEQVVGSHGQSVVCIQKTMAGLGLWSGTPNGVFDAGLQQAIRAFQQSHPPLQADGRAGPRTLAALGIWSGVSPRDRIASGTIGTAPVSSQLTAEPHWNMTPDGIPVYGNRQPCSRPDAITIATEFARDGADIATQYWAVYIASREGGCRHDAVNINPATKDDSHCTFQINVLSGTFEPHGELGRRGWNADLVKASMRDCADAASDLWVFCGRGPWTPPYSCAPPWEGSRSTPMHPINVTTTTSPVVEAAPSEPIGPAPDATVDPPTGTTTTVPSAPPVPETTAAPPPTALPPPVTAAGGP